MEDWIITLLTSTCSAIIAVFIAIFSVNLYQKKKDNTAARLSILTALKETITKSNELFLIWFELWEYYFERKVIIEIALRELEESMRRVFIELRSNWDYFVSFLHILCNLTEKEESLIIQINEGFQKLKLLIYSPTNEKHGILESYNETEGSIKKGLNLLVRGIPELKLQTKKQKKRTKQKKQKKP